MPKPETNIRRVELLLEVETDAPLNELRTARCYNLAGSNGKGIVKCLGTVLDVLEVRANVIRNNTPQTKSKKKNTRPRERRK